MLTLRIEAATILVEPDRRGPATLRIDTRLVGRLLTNRDLPEYSYDALGVGGIRVRREGGVVQLEVMIGSSVSGPRIALSEAEYSDLLDSLATLAEGVEALNTDRAVQGVGK